MVYVTAIIKGACLEASNGGKANVDVGRAGFVVGERVAVLPVDTGLYLLSYGATASSVAPTVFVRASPSSETSVRLVAAPGRADCVLSSVGDCLVVVAARPSSLHVTLSTTVADGGLDANVRLEKLVGARGRPEKMGDSAGNRLLERSYAEAVASLAPAPGREADGAVKFRCLAHVARRGDQAVAAGEWIGGPTTPMRIEGVQLDWTLPPGLQIYYQVLVAGAGGRWSAWVSERNFAGSRGRALPLAGVRFRLDGARAQDFAIRADALFLGSPIESEAGAAVEFVSRTGNDPLVGLRVAIARRDRDLYGGEAGGTSGEASEAELQPAEDIGGMDMDGGAKRRGRVRMFRARRTDEVAMTVGESATL